ncbi:hypothetical protein [Steroidobacter sp.]|uniref:hypothetical protein n=1 Tax=Steroidobacter sp. TaxID=1978227 RepID=UPI0025CFA4ED|nr:hypothetical protein [Steroidobacter sp.]
MLRLALVSASFLFVSLPADAADWYLRVSDHLQRVEQTSSGSIVLAVNNGGIAISVPGQSSSCSITSVLINPPSGREKDWLAMVLAATLAGKAISVYGDCNAGTWQIVSSRMIVEYN